jgi:hypothetical protein
MNFLYPGFLLGALAVAIPIALHLLRRDVAPDLPFSAVRLLKRSPVDRSRRRRLRDILLLAARVAALLLLAAAFARPFAPAAASAMQPLRIIAIDRSFSMGAPGQFGRALELARAAVDEASFGERVALIGFDDRADVLAQPGRAADARAALRTLHPGHGSTRFAAAISRASELAMGGDAQLILISDLQRDGFEGQSRLAIPASLEVDARHTGAPPPNVALVGARLGVKGLVVSLRNASTGERKGAVVLSREGTEVARAHWLAAPHTTLDLPVPWAAVAGGVTVSIEDPGGFGADDTRHLIVGGPASAAVLVVTSPDAPGFYLERALEAAHGDGISSLRPRLVTPALIAGGRAETIGQHRAVVLLSTRSLDRAAREAIAAFVRAGGGLLIAAAPDVEPEVVTALFGWDTAHFAAGGSPREAALTATDARHPIFRPFGGLSANLGQVRFTRAWRVDPAGWHVAAHFDDGSAAVLERQEGHGRVVLFASDLDRRWNDFPLHPSFVPFVVEAVRHISAERTASDEFLVGRLPAGMDLGPGIHRMESGLVAVNVDTRESTTGALTPEEFTAMLEPVQQPEQQQTARDEQTESRQNLWQIGLLVMLATLVVESFIGRA